MSDRPGLRIGDREREAAAAALGEHFAQGRITREEYDERSDVVWAARTESDLRPVFADLPGGHQVARVGRPSPPEPAPRMHGPHGRSRSGLAFPLAPLLLVVVGVALLADGWPVLLLVSLLCWGLASRRAHRWAGRRW